MVLSKDIYIRETMNPYYHSISRVVIVETQNVLSCIVIVLGIREYVRNTVIVKDVGIRSTHSREEML